MGALDKLSKQSEYKDENRLSTDVFERLLMEQMNNGDTLNTPYLAKEIGLDISKKTKRADVYSYLDEEVVLCPEPLSFIHNFDDVSDNIVEADKRFRDLISSFDKITLSETPDIYGQTIWTNKTTNGINLRPGYLGGDQEKFIGVRLNDDSVHGLIAGRTGSGKSVFINQLILSLITEYAPWELNVYLADFKKVELSRYMSDRDDNNGNNPFTPHVRACAATSEIRYVVSLISYLVDCMNARNEMFTRLGVTKIADFRAKYNIVLPRVIFIIDEFQQMFKEATPAESDTIQVMLNSITKLGRSTGFHLVFASQEMSGTLNGDSLSNFKVRMALPCNKDVSSSMIGNTKAADIDRGYVIINQGSGDESQNQTFQVPFISTDESNGEKALFFKYLDMIKNNATKFGNRYTDGSQKFYREELQEREHDFLKGLDNIKDNKNYNIDCSDDLFDALVLGKTVMYSPLKNDKIAMYLEAGARKSILVASPIKDDLARIVKLLYENFTRSNIDKHIYFNFDGLVNSKFEVAKKLQSDNKKVLEIKDEDLGSIAIDTIVKIRSTLNKILSEDGANIIELSDLLNLAASLENNFTDLDIEEADKFKSDLADIESRISDIDSQAKKEAAKIENQPKHPLITFLEKVDSWVIDPDEESTPTYISELPIYNTLVEELSHCYNTNSIIDKYMALVADEQSKYSEDDISDNDSDTLTRLVLLGIALDYYKSRINNTEPEDQEFITEAYNDFYEELSQDAINFEEYNSKASETLEKLNLELKGLNEQKAELLDNRPNLVYAESIVNRFLRVIFDACLTNCELPEDESEYTYNIRFKPGNISVNIDKYGSAIYRIIESELNSVINTLKRWGSGLSMHKIIFDKTIIWINGADRMKYNKYNLDRNISKISNYGVLPILVTPVPIPDPDALKSIDYYFITGNNEKIYDSVNARYTKQALNSIVINAGVVSSGIELPFKIYKSELSRANNNGFMDKLLNGM